ncbi:MAG: N-acetylneuraminate synthase family protein, partial [Bacteroidia bacterium]|nr:N-acetylneuraminate synthase family protein [Bacteroidia bacterium]
PATPENTNLLTIPDMMERYKCIVGLSDHTMGVGASVAAVALGARVIEKHFTLRRADGGVDSAFSLEPEELKSLVTETERAFLALGKVQYGIQAAEEKSVLFKRSIYVSKNIKAGEPFTADNLKIIRPAFGLAPKYWEDVIGKKAKTDLKAGTPLNKSDF